MRPRECWSRCLRVPAKDSQSPGDFSDTVAEAVAAKVATASDRVIVPCLADSVTGKSGAISGAQALVLDYQTIHELKKRTRSTHTSPVG